MKSYLVSLRNFRKYVGSAVTELTHFGYYSGSNKKLTSILIRDQLIWTPVSVSKVVILSVSDEIDLNFRAKQKIMLLFL